MVGTELCLNNMEWSGQDEWLGASRGLWMVDGHHAGWSKELGSLTFLTVYNSGHMVPYNVPGPAFDMLNRVLKHKSFIDEELPTVRVIPDRIQRKRSSSSSSSSSELLLDSETGEVGAGFAELHGEHMRTVGVVGLSMMVGFVAALLLVRRTSGYQRVPNVSLTV